MRCHLSEVIRVFFVVSVEPINVTLFISWNVSVLCLLTRLFVCVSDPHTLNRIVVVSLHDLIHIKLPTTIKICGSTVLTLIRQSFSPKHGSSIADRSWSLDNWLHFMIWMVLLGYQL